MLPVEVLICKRTSAINGRRASPIAMQEIAALDHKVFDLSFMRMGGG